MRRARDSSKRMPTQLRNANTAQVCTRASAWQMQQQSTDLDAMLVGLEEHHVFGLQVAVNDLHHRPRVTSDLVQELSTPKLSLLFKTSGRGNYYCRQPTQCTRSHAHAHRERDGPTHTDCARAGYWVQGFRRSYAHCVRALSASTVHR